MKVEMKAGEERRGRGRPPDFPGPRMAAIGRQRVLRELKARGTNLSRWCRERGYLLPTALLAADGLRQGRLSRRIVAALEVELAKGGRRAE